MTTSSYFQGSPRHPAHLSVGAVLVNSEQQIAVHYFTDALPWARQVSNVHILMRETIEAGETLEETVARGLKEEFGAKGKIRDYLGSIRCEVPHSIFTMQKTTLYFLVELLSIDISQRRPDDPESGSIIEWHQADFLIEKMQTQSQRWKRADLDESSMLQLFLQHCASVRAAVT